MSRRLSGYAKAAAIVVLAGLVVAALGLLLPGFSPSTAAGTIVYLSAVLALGLAYTVIAVLRDGHETLVAWPGVISLLAGSVLWILLGTMDPPWIAVFAVTALFFFTAAPVLLFKALQITVGRDPLDLVYPLLLKSMLGTRSSRDRPSSMTIPLEGFRFRDWGELARFLKQERLTDFVFLRRETVTIRMARIAGLPRFWSLLLLPFGWTVLRVDSHGRAAVCVDGHTYRLLGRPGPYTRFCRNLVDSFSMMASLVSSGRLDEARQMASR